MGAWIETILTKHDTTRNQVAPYVGAWIETPPYVDWVVVPNVAPYVGAWIETGGCSILSAS